MVSEDKCPCGALATKDVFCQGGMGICVKSVCQSCFDKACEHAAQIIKLTGIEWYGMPPSLRPANAFDNENNHA